MASAAWACRRQIRTPSAAWLARRYSVLLFGTDTISAAFLDHLWHKQSELDEHGKRVIDHLEVVCPPDQWVDRGRSRLSRAPIKERALQLGVPVHDAPAGHSLQSFKVPTLPDGGAFDLAVVVSFGYFLTEEVLRAFRLGAYNFHPSLLPKYRGAAPLQYAIMHGDSVTGMTILEISPKAWDAGRILVQQPLTIPPDADFELLSSLVRRDGPPLMLDALKRLATVLQSAKPQTSTGLSHARKITTATAKVDFGRHDAASIERLHRAIHHHHPVHTTWNGQEVLLHELHLPVVADALATVSNPSMGASAATLMPPGSVMVDARKKHLLVACINNSWLAVTKLQLQSRRAMSAWDFANGYRWPRSGVAATFGQ